MTLQAIKYENGTLEVLDQLLLPKESKYIPILGVEDGWKVINKMQVRSVQALSIRSPDPPITSHNTRFETLPLPSPLNQDGDVCHVGNRHVNRPTSLISDTDFKLLLSA